MTARSNPPWSNDILTSNWEQILAAGGPEWMPRHKKARTRITAEEFGTGSYGVVMPTMTPGVVMKLTSDPTEASFVSWAVNNPQFGKDHPGLIPYYKIVPLYDTAYRRTVNPPIKKSGRDVFVLWRAEAEKVGKVFSEMESLVYDAYDRRIAKNASERLFALKTMAGAVRDRLAKTKVDAAEAYERMDDFRGEIDLDNVGRRSAVPSYLRGQKLVSFLLETCRVIAESMANEPFATEVGQTLLDLLEDHGILLADVHTGNIGFHKPNDYHKEIPVITDPGHAVFLKPARVNPVGKWW